VNFRVKIEDFHVMFGRFIPKNEETWIPQVENKEFKNDWEIHSSEQGYWGSEMADINIELLNAINQQVKELRWK
jgi:hypothetical protein